MPAADAVSNSTAQRETRIARWREARFGLFIHWGLYAIPGRGEWVQWNEQIPNEEYAKLAGKFHPDRFDASEWARIAKAAGARYVVLTARHHDGFALFDDPGNAFTSVSAAAHRDFIADFTRAIRSAGLQVGLYYSVLDWRFPGYVLPDIQRSSAEAMRAQYHRQMAELLSNYGKLDVLWFDGGETDWLSFGGDWKGASWVKRPPGAHYQGGFSWGHPEVYAMLRRLQPGAVINGRADMPEDFHSREGDGALGNFDDVHPWELCTTIVDGPWGWSPTARIKSFPSLIRLLVGAAGRDGNFILNVGPRPDGEIDPPQADRLREIGTWLEKYGASIYGTRGGPFLPGDYGVSTHRGNLIYVHVFKWAGEKLVLPALPVEIRNATVLGGPEVSVEQGQGHLEIAVPSGQRIPVDTIVCLQLASSADAIRPLNGVVDFK